jgi:hypothetical protein
MGAPVDTDQIGAFDALSIAVNAPPLPGQYKTFPSPDTTIDAFPETDGNEVDDHVTVPFQASTSYKRRGELIACHHNAFVTPTSQKQAPRWQVRQITHHKIQQA